MRILRGGNPSRRPGRVGVLRALRLLVAAALGLATLPLDAQQERYDYDAVGRLIRRIDADNRVTEYVYDAAGNLLRVIEGASLPPAPVVSSITPDAARRGDTVAVEVAGANLGDAVVTATDAAIDITVLARAPTRLALELTIGAAALLGARALRFSSAAGAVNRVFTVLPPQRLLAIEPAPIAVGPGSELPITLRLSGADVVDHRLSLSVSGEHATVTPTALTIAAGSTEARAVVRGVSPGIATLTVTSATLAPATAPVFVTGEFAGAGTSYAPPVGVVREGGPRVGAAPIDPVLAPPLGVAVGRHVREIAPRALAAGAEPVAVTVAGAGLGSAQSIQVVPAEGITFGALAAAPDGLSLQATVTVASGTAAGPREFLVLDADGSAFPAAGREAGWIDVVLPQPELWSIEPIAVLPGSPVGLALRGRHLGGANAVGIVPPDGVTVAGAPVVAADGRSASIVLTVALNAAPGPRTLIVSTPAGSTAAAPSAANTFAVVEALRETIAPVVAAPLGVLRESLGAPERPVGPVVAPLVGVGVGPVVRALVPAAGAAGSTATLTLHGSDLGGVTAVRFTPAAGLGAGAPVVTADGRSVSVAVTIAADAAREPRSVSVFAGAVEIPFATPSARSFLVTGASPEVHSVTPSVLVADGTTVELVVRGAHLADAAAVRVTPSDGITLSAAPAANPQGTEVRTAIGAAATAAPGPRVVTVVTPAGESATAASPANTLTLTARAGSTVTPVVSPALGVILSAATPTTPPPVGPVVSAPVGVGLEAAAAEPSPPSAGPIAAPALGVAVGPVATAVAPIGFLPGTAATLAIDGEGLDRVTDVAVVPAAGVVVGQPVSTADGRRLTVPIAIEPAAANTVRRIELREGARTVAFAPAAAAVIRIAAGVPAITSIEPILARPGDRFTLIVRGANLQRALAVRALPADGLVFAPAPAANAAGSEVAVDVAIATGAPAGARVIQVLVPGGASSAIAAPANTLVVLPP